MKISQTLFAVSLAALATTGIAAEHAHEQHDHGATPATLTLDQGRKWATDAPLREAMTEIRQRMNGALHDIHAGKLSAAGYAELGGQVRSQVGNIVANCRLEPKADAQLHGVIAELLSGAEAMEGKSKKLKRRAGAVKVINALDQYGAFFEHPGWQALQH